MIKLTIRVSADAARKLIEGKEEFLRQCQANGLPIVDILPVPTVKADKSVHYFDLFHKYLRRAKCAQSKPLQARLFRKANRYLRLGHLDRVVSS